MYKSSADLRICLVEINFELIQWFIVFVIRMSR